EAAFGVVESQFHEPFERQRPFPSHDSEDAFLHGSHVLTCETGRVAPRFGHKNHNRGVRVLFVASDVAPFAKTGGLADVASALPQALAARGHEVRVVMPNYDVVAANGFHPMEAEPGILGFDLGPRKVAAGVRELPLGNVTVTLIDVPSIY